MYIYMYDPRHEFCVGLGRSQEDRFAHDAAHFFTICATFLYNGKGFRINTTFVVIYMYDPRHEFCVELGRSPEDRFAHDVARFFTICAKFLYNGKGFRINTTFVVILNVVMGYLFSMFRGTD